MGSGEKTPQAGKQLCQRGGGPGERDITFMASELGRRVGMKEENWIEREKMASGKI